MFGWEFPPFLTGGLGMACYGLVKALLKRNVDVTLVLPKSIEGASSIEEGFTVFGTDTWEFYLNKEKQEKIGKLKTLRINSPIQPYSGASSPIDFSILSVEALKKIIQEEEKVKKESQKRAAKLVNLYGENLIQEIIKYNEIAASIAATLDFDVIHCHDWLTFGAGMIAKKISGKPLITHVHCTEFDRCPGYGNDEVHKIEKAGCEYADQVVSVSNLTKQILVSNYEIIPEKIRVVHNGIDSGTEYPFPTEFRQKNPKILFLGRVTYQKGPNYFLEAASKVLKFRPDAEFIVAGTGDMIDYLKGRAHELGISDRVNFTGAISADKVQDVYRDVDCFVLSSVSEPFGLTVLEALSQRLPVIASKQSGVSEVLRHILRYDFWDVEALTALILSVITYKPLSDELKEKSVDDLQPITWDNAAEKVESIYNQF